jgi:hypothetical protein
MFFDPTDQKPTGPITFLVPQASRVLENCLFDFLFLFRCETGLGPSSRLCFEVLQASFVYPLYPAIESIYSQLKDADDRFPIFSSEKEFYGKKAPMLLL